MSKINWRPAAYPPPAWVFRVLNLPVNASATAYYAAFDRLVVQRLRFASDAELFSRLVLDKQFIGGMPYVEAVKAVVKENPLLAADAEVTALIEQASMASDGQANAAPDMARRDAACAEALLKSEALLRRALERTKSQKVCECIAEAIEHIERAKAHSGLFLPTPSNPNNGQNP